MNIEYINPFIEASQTVLKQIANIDAVLGKVYLRNSPYRSENIVIMVGLTGTIRGQAILTMSKKLAMSIASSMMFGMPVTEFDEISKSAISELANMILGNTATILYNRGLGVDITPPTMLMGENVEITPNKMRTVCIPLLINDDDKIELDVSFESEGGD
ncbi:MAG: chemotaxis protein CheX [Clostridiales bacterium]|nr:chemotaxis protein CheX [Clostridiales bacterium]